MTVRPAREFPPPLGKSEAAQARQSLAQNLGRVGIRLVELRGRVYFAKQLSTLR